MQRISFAPHLCIRGIAVFSSLIARSGSTGSRSGRPPILALKAGIPIPAAVSSPARPQHRSETSEGETIPELPEPNMVPAQLLRGLVLRLNIEAGLIGAAHVPDGHRVSFPQQCPLHRQTITI